MDELNEEKLYHYKPLGAWAYFGYSLLYSIPIIGLIFMIIHATSNANINRRNHARSFIILLLIGIVLAFIISVGIGLLFFQIIR